MTQDPEQIAKVIGTFEKEAKAIEDVTIDICLNMRGGIGWEEAWGLTPSMRDNIITHINEFNRKMSGDNTEFF